MHRRTDAGQRAPRPPWDGVPARVPPTVAGTATTRTGPSQQTVDARRREVLRRLLDRGLGEATLRRLLPDWDALIDDVCSPQRRGA